MNLSVARVKAFATSLVLKNAHDVKFVRIDCDSATECNIPFDSPLLTANKLGIMSVVRYNELEEQGVFGGKVSHDICFCSFFYRL